MSDASLRLAAAVLAPLRLGITEGEYRTLIEKIAGTLALDDEEHSDAQREADVEEAEWIIGVLCAAGYTVHKVAP